MERLVFTAARLVRAGHKAWGRKWSFLALCVLVFLASLIALAQLDLLPEPRKTVSQNQKSTTPLVEEAGTHTIVTSPEDPVKIEAKAIGLKATISNPLSTDIGVLDSALLSGAVRYPTSAKLGESGNVVVFGHSSYLPIVHNQAYKTFDGIQNLKQGDTLTVYSQSKVYTYAVKEVRKENAESGAIPLAVGGRILTLATCNSFGTKSDRFVVTAEFVESHPTTTS